jgi:hypothetical protein
MSTIVAVRSNPILKEFYERLRAKGKPAKQVLDILADAISGADLVKRKGLAFSFQLAR